MPLVEYSTPPRGFPVGTMIGIITIGRAVVDIVVVVVVVTEIVGCVNTTRGVVFPGEVAGITVLVRTFDGVERIAVVATGMAVEGIAEVATVIATVFKGVEGVVVSGRTLKTRL